MNFSGFFFDLDGTLINSMDNHYLSWNQIIKNEFNFELDRKEFMLTEGPKMEILINDFLSYQGINVEINILNKLIELKNIHYEKNSKIKFYPNVINTLHYLKKNKKKISLVTGGSKRRITRTLKSDFLDLFDCIITRDDCLNSKPSPDPYLKALKIVNLFPNECAALENSPLGIISAKKANLFTYAISNTLKNSELVNADKIISNIKEII